jgi:hypothetical protein
MALKKLGKFFSNLRPPLGLSRFFIKALGVLAFCAVTSYALFLAYGYNFDLTHRDIEKTSIIDVTGRYPDVRVYLGDNLAGNSLPMQLKDLLPGLYNLSVQKLGYLPWSRNLQVQTDFVTKVDDVILVPEHTDQLIQQLVHFPPQSRYFFSDASLIVLSPGQIYLTMVSLMTEGTIKEQEIPLQRDEDIQNISFSGPHDFLITFADNSYEWVGSDGTKPVDFSLPKGTGQPVFLPAQGLAYFLMQGNLYGLKIDSLPALTSKVLASALLVKHVDQFDIRENRLAYLSGGMAYFADAQGNNPRLLDRSHTINYIRFIPFNGQSGGLFLIHSMDNSRSLYAEDDSGNSLLLTPRLNGDVFQDNGGRLLFADGSGNIFLYKPLLQKKTLVATLPTGFTLEGFLSDDGHFVLVKDQQVVLADSSFSNVYPLFADEQNARYFPEAGAVFLLADDRLKSLYFLPKN